MTETGYNRKLDACGRIMIPSKLRERLGLVPGQEYFFFIHEENGHQYICIDAGTNTQITIEQAKQILQQNGIKIIQNDN